MPRLGKEDRRGFHGTAFHVVVVVQARLCDGALTSIVIKDITTLGDTHFACVKGG